MPGPQKSRKRKSLEKSRHYPYTPEQVWCALTDPHAMAEWMMPNDFKPEVGHKFTYQIDPMPVCGQKAEGEVLEVDPPRRLVYSLLDYKRDGTPRAAPSVITWTLTPEEGGTRLDLRHEGLEVLGVVHALMLRIGWGGIMSRMLPKVLANVDAAGLHFEPGAIPLAKRPYKVRTVPDSLIR